MASKGSMTGVKAIKAFFEADAGIEVKMAELKALTADQRGELAQLAAAALGVALVAAK